MSTGRPTKYSEEIVGKSIHYLGHHHEYGDLVPSAVGLACALGVSRRVLYVWAEEHEEFMHILDEIQTAQERKLLSGGLGGDYNSAIVKLMLGKHGYHDKQDVDHSGGITFVAGESELGRV